MFSKLKKAYTAVADIEGFKDLQDADKEKVESAWQEGQILLKAFSAEEFRTLLKGQDRLRNILFTYASTSIRVNLNAVHADHVRSAFEGSLNDT